MRPTTANEVSLVLKRTLRESPSKVFEAWTKPEHLLNWWHAGPAKEPCLAEVDLRPGGRYRLGMKAKESGDEYIVGGEFKEIDPPRKLVYTWEWEHERGAVSIVKVEFKASGENTDLVLTHTGFATAELRDAHKAGWTGCLDAFEQEVR